MLCPPCIICYFIVHSSVCSDKIGLCLSRHAHFSVSTGGGWGSGGQEESKKKKYTHVSIQLKEPFALKNSETVYFTSIFSTPSYSDIAPIDNFDLTFFYFYFLFEVFDTIQF